MTLLFVVGVLAVWREALMITEEEGPFSGLAILRDKIDPHQKTWVGRGIRCLWCVSFWMGLIYSLWVWYFGQLPLWAVPIWWSGLSGGAILLQNYSTKRR